MEKNEKVMVSIICNTYNHEQFIADAIESFLMQGTNFKYEILIHDDASTDKTAEIIKSYEQKYPGIIKPIYQTENQYSKGIKISPTFNYLRAKGKYIALCEGDDYWTDSKKLQMQFDCLEKNPDAVCCYHNAYVFDERSIINKSKLPVKHQRCYTGNEMMRGDCFILTLTAFFRNIDILRDYPPEAKGDTFLFSILGCYGSGIYLPMIKPAAYRVHKGGVWSLKSRQEKKAMRMNTLYWLAEYYSRLGNSELEEEYRVFLLRAVISDLIKKQLILIFIRRFPFRLIKLVKDNIMKKSSA